MSIRISENHLKRLSQSAEEAFYGEIAEWVNENHPVIGETITQPKLTDEIKEWVRYCEEDLDLHTRGAIFFYIKFFVLLGRGFETDPQYRWVVALLGEAFSTIINDSPKDTENEPYAETHRNIKEVIACDEAHDKFDAKYREIHGEAFEYWIEAVRRFNAVTIDKIPVTQERFMEETQSWLATLHPQKVAAMLEDKESGKESNALKTLIEKAQETAKENYRFEAAKHQALIAGVQFFLGHQCYQDPFLTWATPESVSYNIGTLHVVDDRNAAAERLLSNAQKWLAREMEHSLFLIEKKEEAEWAASRADGTARARIVSRM